MIVFYKILGPEFKADPLASKLGLRPYSYLEPTDPGKLNIPRPYKADFL